MRRSRFTNLALLLVAGVAAPACEEQPRPKPAPAAPTAEPRRSADPAEKKPETKEKKTPSDLEPVEDTGEEKQANRIRSPGPRLSGL